VRTDDFSFVDVTFEISEGHWAKVGCRVFPDIPAKISGPPEDCYPSEAGFVEIESVELTWDEEPERDHYVEQGFMYKALSGYHGKVEELAREKAR